MFERRLYLHVDWLLLVAVYLLCAIGVVMIYSASGGSRLYLTQLAAIGLGTVALAVCLGIDYRSLADRSHLIYGFIILLLALRPDLRRRARRRPPVDRAAALQPAAVRVHEGRPRRSCSPSCSATAGTARPERPRPGSIAGALTALPLVLIARQPDLGTAATLVPVLVAVAFVAGMRLKVAGILLAVAVVAAPVVWSVALQDYQKGRILTFVNPSRDPLGAGYQQIQARITAGSGGLWGKGFMKGTQGQQGFLPVAHNDFIFSVLAEEHGFLGVLAALGLYAFVVLRTIETARLARDRLGTLLVIGVLASFTFQVIYNVSMSAGLAPVKGLTLPLMSYGGSSVIATLAGVGLILNVRMRRFTN